MFSKVVVGIQEAMEDEQAPIVLIYNISEDLK